MTPRRRTNSRAVSWAVSSTSRTPSPGRAGLRDRLAERRGDDAVGLERPRRSPQQSGVARLEAQGGGIGGDVRAVLVNDPHDPERDADALHAKPVRAHVTLDDLADGVGQGGHGPQAVRHGGDALLRQPQAGRPRSATPPSRRCGRRRWRWRSGSRRSGRRRRSAARARASSFAAEEAVASRRAAAFARRPRSCREAVDIGPRLAGRLATYSRPEPLQEPARPATNAREPAAGALRGRRPPDATSPPRHGQTPRPGCTSAPLRRRRSGPRACRSRRSSAEDLRSSRAS